ncbi:MAG TPA: Flp pilus assembly protein CpaB [Vicinamibacterales bacterium]
MARIRVFAVLALALVAGGTFAFGTYRYIQNVPAKTINVPTKAVVVAASDLDLGAELRGEDLRVIQWPADAVPMGTFDNPEQLTGRGLIRPVATNEPFLPQKLAPIEAGAGLPPVIPEGFRAVSVRVNDVVGVAGYVLPGTRVDVVATINPTNRPEDVVSKVILTNVQVLAAGTKMEQSDGDNKPVQVSVVTLMVNPDEAERLTLASTEGKIQLALRNPLDKSAPATIGIRAQYLLAGGVPSRPVVGRLRTSSPQPALAQPVAAPPTVEIIRGDKRAQEVVGQEK